MQWTTRSIVLLLILVLSCISHASDRTSVFGPHGEKNLFGINDDKIEMNDAIKMYLQKNPPEELMKLMCLMIEKSQPVAIPEVDRERVLNHFKKNITSEILTKMISAGLNRNFTTEEIIVLAKYDDSQLSDNLKKKNDFFRQEVSSEIGLLLAATSG